MSEANNRPVFRVASKREHDGKEVWRDVAVIFNARNGNGYDVMLKCSVVDIQAGDRLFLRAVPPVAKGDKSPAGKQSGDAR